MGALKKVADVVFRRHKKQYDLEDYIAHQKARGFDIEQGSLQIVDSTPMAPPIGYKKAPSMAELVREAVRSHHLAAAAAQADMETFEESEDFDIPDDPVQMESPYENDFDPPISELIKAGREVVEERRKAAASRPAPKPGPDADAENNLLADPKLPENLLKPKS